MTRTRVLLWTRWEFVRETTRPDDADDWENYPINPRIHGHFPSCWRFLMSQNSWWSRNAAWAMRKSRPHRVGFDAPVDGGRGSAGWCWARVASCTARRVQLPPLPKKKTNKMLESLIKKIQCRLILRRRNWFHERCSSPYESINQSTDRQLNQLNQSIKRRYKQCFAGVCKINLSAHFKFSTAAMVILPYYVIVAIFNSGKSSVKRAVTTTGRMLSVSVWYVDGCCSSSASSVVFVEYCSSTVFSSWSGEFNTVERSVLLPENSLSSESTALFPATTKILQVT